MVAELTALIFGGKWKLLGYEDRDKNSVMDILPEGVGIWWINVQE